MSLETYYRVCCDEKDCGQNYADALPFSRTRDEARLVATLKGWDLGPRRRGSLVYHTDYCPVHKKREPGKADR